MIFSSNTWTAPGYIEPARCPLPSLACTVASLARTADSLTRIVPKRSPTKSLPLPLASSSAFHDEREMRVHWKEGVVLTGYHKCF